MLVHGRYEEDQVGQDERDFLVHLDDPGDFVDAERHEEDEGDDGEDDQDGRRRSGDGVRHLDIGRKKIFTDFFEKKKFFRFSEKISFFRDRKKFWLKTLNFDMKFHGQFTFTRIFFKLLELCHLVSPKS